MTERGKRVALNVKRLLLNQGLSIADAVRPRMYDIKLRDILNGKREPNEVDIWLLTKALNCSEDELLMPCEEMDWSKVGANIKTKLKEMGKTQLWLSSESGLPNSTLSLICTGLSRRPRPFNLMCIAEALGCKTEDLFR